MVAVDDGAQIHTLTAGEGPRVVLVHGLTSNVDDLGPLAERLIDAGYSVTGVDQRGHGRSTVGAGGFGAARQARDLRQVLEQLDLTGVTLVGHSMGGITILQLAIDHPDALADRVERLALLAAPTSLGSRWRRVATQLARLPQPQGLLPDHRRLRSIAAASVFGRRPSLFMIDQALASYFRCPPSTRRDATLGLRTYDVTGRLAEISAPTTVIVGDLDRIVPPGNALVAADRIPDARSVVLEGAGHMLIWERVEDLAREIALPGRAPFDALS